MSEISLGNLRIRKHSNESDYSLNFVITGPLCYDTAIILL